MMKKSEKDGDILMTGGGSLNIGLHKAFEEELLAREPPLYERREKGKSGGERLLFTLRLSLYKRSVFVYNSINTIWEVRYVKNTYR